MSISYSYNGNEQTGNIGVLSFGGTRNFSDLFTGLPQYYPGSTIQVQEIISVLTKVTDSKLVDVDFNWWEPKQYLGTFQVLSAVGLALHRDGDDGYLVSPYQEITRYSRYTITANPSVPIALNDGFIVNDCNFFIKTNVRANPVTGLPQTGQDLVSWGESAPVFRGYNSFTAAPLADTPVNLVMGGIGLLLRPGVALSRVDYKAAIINDIYTAYSPFPIQTCNTIPPTCSEQFTAFMQSHSTGSVTGRYYYDQPTCVSTSKVGCAIRTWTCPTNSADKRTYWIPQPL
jgi:hypothetical protein